MDVRDSPTPTRPGKRSAKLDSSDPTKSEGPKIDFDNKTNELYLKIQSKAFEILILQQQAVSKDLFITAKDVNKLKEKEQQLIRKFHEQALSYLTGYKKSLKQNLPGSAFLIPREFLSDITSFVRVLPEDQRKLLNQFTEQGIPETDINLPTKDFIETVNRNLEITNNKPLYLEAAKQRVEEKFQSSFEDKNHLYPLENELSNRRSNLLPLFEINDPSIKEAVLLRYITLCEADPITENTMHDLVENLKNLIEWHEKGIYNSLKPELFVMSVKSIALTLECILLQIFNKKLPGQQEEIKESAIKVSRAFKNLNIHKVEEVQYWASFALFASHSIETSSSILPEVLSGIIKVAQLGCKISTAVLAPSPGTIAEVVEEGLKDIGEIYDAVDFGGDWFNDALALKRMMRIAIFKHRLFQEILPALRTQNNKDVYTTKTPAVREAAASPRREQEAQVTITPIQSTFFRFFSIQENLELAILGSPEERVSIDAFKLLTHNLFSNNSLFLEKTIRSMMMLVKRGEEKIKNTAHILLEICAKGKILDEKMYLNLKSELAAFLSEIKSDLKKIKRKNHYYIPVIKNFINQTLEIRRFEDNAGINLINLLGYSQRTIDEFLEVFLRIPVIREDIYDYRGNTIYHVAAETGNDQTIKATKEKSDNKIPINSKNKDGEYPIHCAVIHHHLHVFEALLEAGADPSVTNAPGDTPLTLAIKQRTPQTLGEHLGSAKKTVENKEKALSIIRYLCQLQQKEDNINHLDLSKKSALNYAIANSDLEVIHILEEHGAKVAEEHFGFSPLMVAIREKKWTVVIYYLDKKTPTFFEMAQIIHLISPNGTDINSSLHPDFLSYFAKKVLSNLPFRNCFSKFLSLPHPTIISENGTPINLTSEEQLQEELLPKPICIKIMPDENSVPITIKQIQEKAYDKITNEEVNATDSLGCTPLMFLANDKTEEGLKVAEMLIQNNASIETKNLLESDAIISACIHENLPFLQLLERHGANFETACAQGFTPAHIAASLKNREMLRYLQGKLPFNAKNHYGETLLHVYCGLDPRTEPFLLTLSPTNPSQVLRKDPSEKNNEPQQLINKEEEQKIIELLAQEINPLEKDCFGNTCLHRAVYYGNAAIVEILLTKFPDLFWIRNDQGLLPIQILLQHDFEERHEDKVKAFNCAPLDIDRETLTSEELTSAHLAASMKLLAHLSRLITKKKSMAISKNKKTGETPLHEAAKVGFKEIIPLYVANQIPLDPQDNLKNTPLHLACLFGHFEFAKAYIENNPKALFKETSEGKQPIENIDGRQAIHLAALRGNIPIVELLIQNGATLNVPDSMGELPLQLAARYGHNEMTACLLALYPKGAYHYNDDGLAALHIAALQGHFSIVMTLLTSGDFGKEDGINHMIHHQEWFNQKPQLTLLRPMNPGESHDILFSQTPGDRSSVVNPLFLNSAGLGTSQDRTGVKRVSFAKDVEHPQSHPDHNIGASPLRITTDVDTSTSVEVASPDADDEQIESYMNLEETRLDPDMPDYSGLSALLHAASRGHSKTVRALLIMGADRKKTTNLGETALHLAAHGLHEQVIYDLLNYDARHRYPGEKKLSKVVDLQGDSVLKEVLGQAPVFEDDTLEKRRRIVCALLKAKCPVNSSDSSGSAPIHYAMRYGFVGLTETLFKESFSLFENSSKPRIRHRHLLTSIEIRNNLGDTPMHEAAKTGNVACLQLLLDQKYFLYAQESHPPIRRTILSDTKNHQGETPMWLAASKGHFEAFNLLMEHGGDISTTDQNNRTMYHLIYSQNPLTEGHKKILEVLFRRWPKGVYKTDRRGSTCLHALVETAPNDNDKVGEMQELLRRLPPSQTDRLNFFAKKSKGRTAQDMVPDKNVSLRQHFRSFLSNELGADYQETGMDHFAQIVRRVTHLRRPSRTTSSEVITFEVPHR